MGRGEWVRPPTHIYNPFRNFPEIPNGLVFVVIPILLGHKGYMRMFWQWVRVMWRERGVDAFKGVWRGYWMIRHHGVSKVEWIRRMKVCMKCPIYDNLYKACRLGKMGCGCYVPFSNLVKKQCWSRDHYGLSFGWSDDDKKSPSLRKLNYNWRRADRLREEIKK